MKIPAIAVGALFATLAGTASAQVYYERPYNSDPNWGARADWRDARDECWNPRAGHFEQVRPGEVQNDLDFSRCRAIGGRYYERRVYRDSRQECWNPRAGHYEEVRPGEDQGDLDFGRCRLYR
jgi:hypothetical protein